MAVEVRIPSLGESVSEGTIARWFKQSGEFVERDEPLLELETDKAAMEISAESAGKLEILQPQGATVPVGTAVGRIDDSAKRPAKSDGPAASPQAPEAKAREPSAPAAAEASGPSNGGAAEKRKEEPAPEPHRDSSAPPPMSPALRRLAREQGVEVASLRGSGPGGRVLREDVERGSNGAGGPPRRPTEVPPAEGRRAEVPPPRKSLDAKAGEGVERVPMTTLRRRIAERLVEAQRTAAILTTFNEADLSAVMALRKKYREKFKEKHGVDLGFMSIFGRAVCQAIGEVRALNAQLDGNDIVYFPHVNLGIAVSTPRGLVVPVVRGADKMSLWELEAAIGELAGLAKQGKLMPDHLSGGTFTISNGGVFGSLLSTPILTPPQTGILGMHKIQERPVVIDGQIVVRPMMYLALSYDHRLIDGEQAVTFLVKLKDRIEDPQRLLLGV